MSNCIELVAPCLRLKYNYVDAAGLRDLIDSVKDLSEPPKDLDGYIAWWFLATNTEFSPRYVQIMLGRGRSSHTNRDFRQTLIVLSKFMFQSVKVEFVTTDEYDGFRRKNREVVDLKNPEWKGLCI